MLAVDLLASRPQSQQDFMEELAIKESCTPKQQLTLSAWKEVVLSVVIFSVQVWVLIMNAIKALKVLTLSTHIDKLFIYGT